jgi:hypothetical protein
MQANMAKKIGDLETAYILYMKFTTFVLQSLPTHLSYNATRFDDEKVASRTKCVKALKELEVMQDQIIQRHNQEMATTIQQFPSVPKNS